MPAPPGTNDWLDTWGFNNPANWASDFQYLPISYTNLSVGSFGTANALVVDSTNAAWLRYHVTETNGATELTVDSGTFSCWIAANWSSTNLGGKGPGQYGRLVECGTYSTNASYGWWSLYLNPAGTMLLFAGQTNNGNGATYLTAPISWTNQAWHQVVLTYSSTNSALYVDGTLLTNGLAPSYRPNAAVLTNGFTLGSDSTGVAQVHGQIASVATYSFPLDMGSIGNMFLTDLLVSGVGSSPTSFVSANFAASTAAILEGITGLLPQGSPVSNCTTGDINTVWITNLVASSGTNNTATFSFSVAGGQDGVPYDVFANAVLWPTNDPAFQWAWLGQVYHCYTYTLSNMPSFYSFVRLGTPYDSDADGIPDAVERLVFHSNPNSPSTSGDGISDLYKVLHGLPLTNSIAVPSLSSISVTNCPIP